MTWDSRAAPDNRRPWHSSHSSTRNSRSVTSRCSITRTSLARIGAHRPDRPQRRGQVFDAQDPRRDWRRRTMAPCSSSRTCASPTWRRSPRWTWRPHVFAAASEGLAHVIASREMYLNAVEGADLDALQSEIEAYDAWNWEQRVEETLHRLHLDPEARVGIAFRRHAQARRAGAGAGGRTRRAAAGRADQPPGPRFDRMAGAAADRLQGQRGHDHPRPQLPRIASPPASSNSIGAS